MNDELEATGRVKIPTAWAVGVITALATAIGGSGAGAYKMGKLESEVAILKKICQEEKGITAESSPAASQK